MHELGVARDLLETALQTARSNRATRVTGLSIEISALADESADALRFHLEHLTRGTIAEGAQVEITRLAPQLQCLDCGKISPLDENGICPHCASVQVRPVIHDEFNLVRIDIE